jgi:hypothetical protein
MCDTQYPKPYDQGQGHTQRSKIKTVCIFSCQEDNSESIRDSNET